jgi:type IV pilus assembly protein PilE
VGDGTAIYTLNVTVAATSQSYTITAAPVAGSAMATDACGNFTLTNTGRRGVSGTEALLTCWR